MIAKLPMVSPDLTEYLLQMDSVLRNLLIVELPLFKQTGSANNNFSGLFFALQVNHSTGSQRG